MKILIVEDNLFVAEDLKDKLEQLQYRVTAIAGSFDEALACIQIEIPDLALLDIELKGELTGIDLAEKLGVMKIPFIYLTGIQDHNTYSKAKNTTPLKNLAKPIDLLNLRNALWDIDLSKTVSTSPIIHLIADKDKKIRIDPNNIIYVKAAGSYCDVYFSEKNKSTLTMSLGEFLEKLAWPDVIRISRFHAVNLNHLERVRGNEVYMKAIELPIRITEKFRETFFRHLHVL